MMWRRPLEGDIRTRRKFLWFPKGDPRGEVRWLSVETLRETYILNRRGRFEWRLLRFGN